MLKKIKNLKTNYILIILTLIPIFLFIYVIIISILLQLYSLKFEKEFNQEKLKGKTIKEVVRVLGKPGKIDYEVDWVQDKNLNFVEGDYYFTLIYYTDNKIFNGIGWFPLGGTRIFVDKNGLVTGFKEHLD